jgi:hypothetical protein
VVTSPNCLRGRYKLLYHIFPRVPLLAAPKTSCIASSPTRRRGHHGIAHEDPPRCEHLSGVMQYPYHIEYRRAALQPSSHPEWRNTFGGVNVISIAAGLSLRSLNSRIHSVGMNGSYTCAYRGYVAIMSAVVFVKMVGAGGNIL